MSNPKFEIECMMWSNTKEKNKWEIVDDENGSYKMVPDLVNLRVEENPIIIDEEKATAYRIINGEKQNMEYKNAQKIKKDRIEQGKRVQKVKEKREAERAE
ncbi:MAG: hypothetical protein IJH39_04265 [Clostridia bacterium]|nr:hypothetical protein [Clostridia bacterium]